MGPHGKSTVLDGRRIPAENVRDPVEVMHGAVTP